MDIGCCGADCNECDKYKNECSGCREMKGKVYWTIYTGENCPIHDCCIGKGMLHCGSCSELPCRHYFENTDPRLTDEEKKVILSRSIETLKKLN